MLSKSHWLLFGFASFLSCGIYAKACSLETDCLAWEPKHCACGVHANCHGITKAHPVGRCHCFGAEGVCYPSSSSVIRIRGANPIRRIHPNRPDAEDTRLEKP